MTPSMSFGGETYDEARDGERLKRQLDLVKRAMSDKQWHTLMYLSIHSGAPEASVSARLRDLRKSHNGSHVIESRFVHRGLFEYRMDPEKAEE